MLIYGCSKSAQSRLLLVRIHRTPIYARTRLESTVVSNYYIRVWHKGSRWQARAPAFRGGRTAVYW